MYKQRLPFYNKTVPFSKKTFNTKQSRSLKKSSRAINKNCAALCKKLPRSIKNGARSEKTTTRQFLFRSVQLFQNGPDFPRFGSSPCSWFYFIFYAFTGDCKRSSLDLCVRDPNAHSEHEQNCMLRPANQLHAIADVDSGRATSLAQQAPKEGS